MGGGAVEFRSVKREQLPGSGIDIAAKFQVIYFPGVFRSDPLPRSDVLNLFVSERGLSRC